MGLYPDIDFMFSHEGFHWDELAQAWRHVGTDPHLPDTTMLTFVRPAYVTVSLASLPDKNCLNAFSDEARRQLDQYLYQGPTPGKMAELQRDIAMIFDTAWLPGQGVQHIMASIKYHLGLKE